MRLQLPPRDSEGNDKEPSLGQICLAGAGSGMVGSYVPLELTPLIYRLLTCPMELVKVSLIPKLNLIKQIRQQSAPPHLSPSVIDVCRHIIRTDGIRGMYRGFSATFMRDIAYGPYFCT